MNRYVKVPSFLATLLVSLVSFGALAQYPTKAIHLVVPYDAGGPSDILTRVIAPLIAQDLGQPVVVENRPGAGTLIGTTAVVRAAPDGYTYLVTGTPLSLNASVLPKLPYDTLNDLAPVAPMGITPFFLFANAAVPANSVKELVALATLKPGTIAYGSTGAGTIPRLAGAQLALRTKTQLVHVPYKGTGPAMNDLLGGHIQLYFTGLTSAMQHLQAGKIKVLAAAAEERVPFLPNVPTMAEAGFKDFKADAWFGIFAPSGTSNEIKERFARAVAKAMQQPETLVRFEALGAIPFKAAESGIPQFESFFRKDVAYWKTFVDGNQWLLND